MLFFATENSKQPKITYLQHVSFTFIFFPFDVSFYFFSCFLFSFSFFSLVISALRAFLFFSCTFPFSPRVLYSLPALTSLCHHRDAYCFRPVSVDLAALLPSSDTCPRSKVQRDKNGIFLPHPEPLLQLAVIHAFRRSPPGWYSCPSLGDRRNLRRFRAK